MVEGVFQDLLGFIFGRKCLSIQDLARIAAARNVNCQALNCKMVEVRGIEPLSENFSRQASTCVVRVLINRQDLPRTGYITGESALVSQQGHRHSLKLSHYN